MDSLIPILISVLGGAIFFGFGIWVVNRLAGTKQGYPLEAEIEAALLPFLLSGIALAYRTSEWAMDDIQTRMRGADKAALSNQIYEMLPDSVGGYDLDLVKQLVPPGRFAVLIQEAFDNMDTFTTHHRDEIDQLYEDWRQTHKVSLSEGEANDVQN